MPIILGQKTGAIQQPEYKSRLDIKGGGLSIKFWTWTQAEADAKKTELRRIGWGTVEVEQDGIGFWITATIDASSDPSQPPQEPVNQWTVTSTIIEEDLLGSDRPSIMALTTQTKALMRYKLKNPKDERPIVEFAKITDEAYISRAGEIYTLLVGGHKTRRIVSKTLKRTITVSDDYETTWLNDSEGMILTTPRLVGQFYIPTKVAVMLPNPAEPRVILNLNDGIEANEVLVYYGWYDFGVNRTFSSNGSVQISQEWEWGKWPLLSYDLF